MQYPIQNYKHLRQISQETGLDYQDLIYKCMRFNINPNGFISTENQRTLSTLFVREGKVNFEIVPSKMNYETN